MSESLNIVNPGNGDIPDLIIIVTYYLSSLIITKLDSTKKFINEIGELIAVFGHTLGASGVQISHNNLDNLQSIREEDGTLETLDPLDFVVSEVGIVEDYEVLHKDLTMVEESAHVEYKVKTVVDIEEWCTESDSLTPAPRGIGLRCGN
ncbi:hypothetical protein Tco_0210477 [Tanacetum coccineum]